MRRRQAEGTREKREAKRRDGGKREQGKRERRRKKGGRG